MWKILQKRKITTVVVLLIVTGLGALWLIPADKPQIIGNISSADVAQIEHLIHGKIWHGTFPDWSWNSIKRLPATIYSHRASHIKYIRSLPKSPEVPTNETVEVEFGKSSEGDIPDPIYVLQKSSNQWQVTGGIDRL